MMVKIQPPSRLDVWAAKKVAPRERLSSPPRGAGKYPVWLRPNAGGANVGKRTKPAARPSKAQRALQLANELANARDADLFVYNFGLESGVEFEVRRVLSGRKAKRTNLVLFLTTEGGDPDSAYRIARCFQSHYQHIAVVVCGWCKSGGTLICIGAHELVVADDGELGPLDIQLTKVDEWEHSSGLAIEAAFEKLQEESFRLFIKHVQNIKQEAAGRITFRTAAEIAAKMVVGVTSDIFAKIDPLSVGEDHRATLIAEQYAFRLNLKANNLRPDTDYEAGGLRMLLRGYPSHGFAIDREEAKSLFRRVSRPTGQLAELTELFGMEMVLPRSSRRNQSPRLEFLNDEKRTRAKSASRPKRGSGPRVPAGSARTPDLPRNLPESAEQNPGSGGKKAA